MTAQLMKLPKLKWPKLLSLEATHPLGPLQIFWRFTKDTLLLAGIYVLLVVATLVLRYFANLVKDSPIHYAVLNFLEHAIFLCGTGIVFMVLLYVTLITATDLVRSFLSAVSAPPVLALPQQLSSQ